MPPEETYLTGGFLGMGHAPLLIGNKHDDNLATPGYQLRTFESAADVSPARFDSRRGLLDRFEAFRREQGSVPTLQNYERVKERAFDLLTGPAARAAFDIEKEPEKLRDEYGRNPLGQNLLLA